MLIAPGTSLPGTGFHTTSLDWRIIGMMMRNAEGQDSGVSESLGIFARTVKNRPNRMMDASTIFVVPMTDIRRTVGISYQGA